MSKNRRSILLINPGFQGRFMAYTAGIALVTTGVFYGAVHYFFWRFRELGASLGLPPTHLFFRFLEQQRAMMNWYWLAVSALAIVLIAAAGLLLSHRVAGPLYKLKSHMDGIAGGKAPEPIVFREKDFFPELANSFNTVLERLGKKKDAA